MDHTPQHFVLDASNSMPLYRQLYECFVRAIDGGVLRPGDRVAATRSLAQQLGLARGTVATAYSMLVADGFLETQGQAGSVVAARRRTAATPAPLPASAEAAGAALGAGTGTPPLPFQMGLPALDVFPRKLWARIAAKAARATQAQQMVRECSAGTPDLRLAIARHLQFARGVACTPEQVFVTAGYRNSMALIMRALLAPGDQVWVEDPGYPPTAQLLRGAGMQPVPVPVDAEGLQLELGLALAPAARAAVLTPAHQSPLTMALSPQRRAGLLDWAAQSDAWLVEDDYDSEFHYTGRPLPALAGQDRNGRVIYTCTFSKTLFPAIRLAYVVVPPALVARFNQANNELQSGCPVLTQNIVSDFMQHGHYTRHIQRMRKLYGERRQHTLSGLARALDGRARFRCGDGGMHLLLDSGGNDACLAAHMRSCGMAPLLLADWYAVPSAQAGLLLSFTNITSEEQAYRLGLEIARLRDA